MSSCRVVTCTALFLVLLSAHAHAQTVRGQAREQGTRTPVQAAMIVLLDEQDAQHGRVFSDAAGRFTVRAPVPGRYRLRLELIGFRNAETPLFQLGEDETIERNIDAPLQAVVLDGIMVESQRRCVVRPDEGLAVATLWEEARKALHATAAADAQRLYGFQVNRYTRRLEQRSLRVIRDSSTARTGFSDGSPFVSLPAAHLLSAGFIEQDADGTWLYHAPDAQVLLSDEFADAYCFRLAESTADGLVGIAFEPASRRGPPGVQGTLWLDRASFALRHLEYRYTRAELPRGAERQVGGFVEFEAVPSGAWIVRRWWVRMPVLEYQGRQWWRAPGVRLEPQLAGYTEDGAEVLEVLASSGERVGGASLATLTGTVTDSVTGTPLAGAEVYLSGTSHRVASDANGRFELRGLTEGEFTVGFLHPRLGLYDLGAGPPRAVSITRGQHHTVHLAVPAAAVAGGLAAECADALTAGRPGERGALRGVVRDELSGVTLPGAVVRLVWDGAGEGGDPQPREVQVTSRADGSYVACGVAEDRPLEVRVSHLGRAGSDFALDPLGRAGYGERMLALRVSRPVPVALLLQDHASGQPIAAATVTLPALGASGVTDADGRVSFEVPSGSLEFRIAHLAYGEHSREITIGLEAAIFEVRVPSAAVALEGITVTARRRDAVEAARRASGTRLDVLTRVDLERFENTAQHVGHIVDRFPGLQVSPVQEFGKVQSGLCIEMRRAKTSLECQPVMIVLDGIPLSDTEPLMALTPNAIESIEFLPPAVAGVRWGTGSMNGALVIYTRGNGPYGPLRQR